MPTDERPIYLTRDLDASQDPERHLFEGLRTSLTQWHGAPLDQIEQWLHYHVERFGLQGVMLVAHGQMPARTEQGLAELAARIGLARLVMLRSHVFCLPLRQADLPPVTAAPHTRDMSAADTARSDTRASDIEALYHAVRWRFLNGAGAVMNIALSDLLCPGSDPFHQLAKSSSGVVQLHAERIYPWRVRKGHAPQFGDHICRQFAPPPAPLRWCVAPAQLSAANIWRLNAVSGVKIGPQDRSPVWRAMSLRHPHTPVARIVAKSSIAEDRALIELACDVFGHKPVRAPQPTAHPTISSGRSCIVTCMKNEGPFILEWIAYHRAIGFDDFLIYTNDCSDGTDILLDRLQARGIVQHRSNPFRRATSTADIANNRDIPDTDHNAGQKPQHAALHAAMSEPVVQNCDWLISMDVDEFVNIHVGQGRLRDLFAVTGKANMIALTWRLFGNADIDDFNDQFITEQFMRCAPQFIRSPHQAWGLKTLYRNLGFYKKLGVHRPKGLKAHMWDRINWVNGSGKPMPRTMLRSGWRSSVQSYGYDLVTLNHYAVRSAESFLVKKDRGRVNHTDRDQGLGYWFRMNNNAETDLSIRRHAGLLRAEHDRLMADPEIRAAHKSCVTAHRDKISQLRQMPDMAALFEHITGPRMKNLSRNHRHFANSVFLEGPDSIPDAVALADRLPHGFFFKPDGHAKP